MQHVTNVLQKLVGFMDNVRLYQSVESHDNAKLVAHYLFNKLRHYDTRRIKHGEVNI